MATFFAYAYRQLNVFDHLISQKVRSFRTFSKLLEALQCETALNRDMWRIYMCSDPGRNSDPSSNWCSLVSTYVNTNLSVDPFDAIFDPTGNPVFKIRLGMVGLLSAG